MVINRLWIVILVFFALFHTNNAVTHWVVTEKGMIQSHSGSPLDLRRPYDLISLLDQEKRWTEIQSVFKDLTSRKTVIEQKWSTFQGDNPDAKMNVKSADCLDDSKFLSTIDLYSNIATNGSDRIKIAFDFKQTPDQYQVPHCNTYNKVELKEDLPDLTGGNFSLGPEATLQKLMPVESVQQFGHEINSELTKNDTSWVHYNLAALYWRVKGDAHKALECCKKSLSFVSLEYRDIPLHNLAGILHRAQKSNSAISVLEKAIQTSPKQALHYLALGNIYSTLGDYNNSLVYYDKFLELKPSEEVAKIKKVTQCFSKLQTHIVDFQENVLGFLQGILSDLHEFHSRQQHWLRLSERLMWEHSSFDEELTSFSAEALDLLVFKKNQRCIQKIGDSNNFISCDNPAQSDFDNLNTLNLQNLFQYVETETQRINERMSKLPVKTNNYKDNVLTYQKFPNSMSTNDKYFDVTGWPKEDDCLKWDLPVNEQEDLKLPVFLPPENKGYEIGRILSDLIHLPNGKEHKLPWYPPKCDDSNVLGEKYLQQSDRQLLNTELKSNQFLRHHFTKYVNGGKADEAEIGQRIITATEKEVAPGWVLANLASLYWRIRGNTRKALACLDLALQTAPKEHTDVMLVSISSIINELGLTEQSMKYANLAFKLNYVEPATNFLLALLHYETNPLLAMYYMKNVLRVDGDFYDGKAEWLLRLWGCRIKLGYNKKNEVCQEKEIKENKVEGMICSPQSEKGASILCFHTKDMEGAPPKYGQTSILTNSKGEFYVDLSRDSQLESMLKVKKAFPLNLLSCKRTMEADWINFDSLYQSVSSRKYGIAHLLKSGKGQVRPYCTDAYGTKSSVLDELTSTILRIKLPNSGDKSLIRLLNILVQDTKSSVEEIGTKIGLVLRENTTSWLLANAAAIYWRIIGDSEEAIICLRLALSFAPEELKDFPLTSLANLLLRIDFNGDALGVGYMALKINKNTVLNYFTVGNILASMGDLEEAISFYRQSLVLEPNFEPARNRLKSVLCTLYLIESGTINPIWEISGN